MTNFAWGFTVCLLLATNRQSIRAWYRRWFDRFDRWAATRWPVTPKGRGEPLPDATEAFIESMQPPPWTIDTRELQIQLRHWAFEE